MLKFRFVVLVLITLFGNVAIARDQAGAATPRREAPASTAVLPSSPYVPQGYSLAWSDEFSEEGPPDPRKWTYDRRGNRTGWYSHERVYYAAERLENARVTGGHLVITAQKDGAAVSKLPDYGGQGYTSARLMTRGKAAWTYGYFEVRAKLACGQGSWPAIWMLGATEGHWPDIGEIDIMEHINSEPAVVGSVHLKAMPSGVHERLPVSTACSDFHVYQLLWTPDRIRIGVDGNYYFTYSNEGSDDARWPYDKPQYLLLNLAYGGDWPELTGTADDKILPLKFEVDYVRVYQLPR